MHARVGRYEAEAGNVDALVDGFQSQTEPLEQLDGFRGAYFLVDRSSGKAMTVTLWDSEEALQASAERAQQLREAGTQPAGAATTDVGNYEVAITVGL